MAMTKVVYASNGKAYSALRLRNVVRGTYISKHVPLNKFPEIFQHVGNQLTYHDIAKLVREAKKEDLRRTIILDPNGSIVVGILSLLKALIDGKRTIRMVRISTWEDMQPAYFEQHKTSAYMHVPTTYGRNIISMGIRQ